MECGHVPDSCGMPLIAVVIHGMWFARLSRTIGCYVVWTDLRPGLLVGNLVSKLLRCLRPLEEVIQGRLFSSLFVVNIGEAKWSLKGHVFGDRTYSVIS